MIKSDLVKKMAEKSGLTQVDAEKALDAFMDSVVEAMLWMRDRIMKEMKYMVIDANYGNRAIIPCGDECYAELDVDTLSEHINAEIMDMF